MNFLTKNITYSKPNVVKLLQIVKKKEEEEEVETLQYSSKRLRTFFL